MQNKHHYTPETLQAETDARNMATVFRTLKSGLSTCTKAFESLQANYSHFEKAVFQREFYKRLRGKL